ncbi:abortive infection bacteriophage resistance protein [Sphingomonas sp. SORGH_AS 950]|uniref:Abi family protein n=1 Tax=Sphingomonas sp. SORGH_AS_0950 TaxID=3041792 RepID=UPI0027839032|nr:Abi family protein [Sphingomonas sp. SORGH_AS_0950]MDQ1159549.1 abortive infection bacteriophage resistance protein [Sphingomonas sp. SORGH_AS_0950]
MTLAPYTKPHATAAQRVQHLRNRGLVVLRPNVAARKIELIGYERLRIYFISRRQSGVPNRPFVPGTTYQHILQLYACDGLLREACFAAVGQFELLLRNAMSETLSDRHGSHPYFTPAAFRDAAANIEALQSFTSAYGQTKDQRALHYRQRYGSPILPPIWTMKEFLTFGRAVRIFKTLEGSLRTQIAGQFGVPSDQVFTNWLECLVDLRNICAHHDRLFNRSFPKQPQGLRRAGLPTAPRNKLKAILECLDYLLAQRGAPVGIVAKVGRIIARFPEVPPAEVGY